jgi:threonine synthase
VKPAGGQRTQLVVCLDATPIDIPGTVDDAARVVQEIVSFMVKDLLGLSSEGVENPAKNGCVPLWKEHKWSELIKSRSDKGQRNKNKERWYAVNDTNWARFEPIPWTVIFRLKSCTILKDARAILIDWLMG